MGSEKKKKDKKKDKKKKSRHSERSESTERRDKKRHKHESPDSNADNFAQASLSVNDSNKLREKLGLKPLEDESKKVEVDQNVVSLSIDETNKLREKLGMKPLEVADKSGDVHVPAKNMGKILETEKLAEKMKLLQEKRRIKQQLSSVKSLGAGSTDLTDTVAWIQRSRTIDSKKAAAAAQTKLLDAMDDEFGIGELVESNRFGREYTNKNMKDLTVLHDVSSFKEGDMTILTLQDKEILDEEGDEDVLINVNMLDNEKVDRNNDLKKKKPDYNPYTEDIDEFGNVKRQNMLSKYDEVIEGEKKRSFKLSEAQNAEVIKRKMSEGLQQRPGNISLDTAYLKKTATEYFTTDEVTAFKKPRKKKIRKIRKTKVDEIAPLPNEEKLTGRRDHGSRAAGGRSKGSVDEVKIKDNGDNMEIDIDDQPDSNVVSKKGSGGKISERELYSVRLEEEDNELEAALARSRRSNIKENKKTILETLSQLQPKEEAIPGVAKASQIVLDRTAEFAKGIGGSEEKEPSETPIKPEPMETEEPVEKISDWKDVDFVTATFGEFQDYDPSRVDTQEVIEAEPSLQRGLSGALQVAQRKGFIDINKKSVNSKDISDAVQATGSLRARFYQVDKDTGQDVDTRRRGDREYSSGQFPEKRNYNPDVKIAYTDSIGRELNSKEAFRQLSHKFHGKGSGKMKTEKRMKKAVEEMSLKKMESDDTPLGSAALFREKQKDANSAYIVLSGGNRIPQDVNNNISKLSKR